MAKLLLDSKSNLNIQDNDGETPLHKAMHNIELMKLLIYAKADVNIQVAASSNKYYSKDLTAIKYI